MTALIVIGGALAVLVVGAGLALVARREALIVGTVSATVAGAWGVAGAVLALARGSTLTVAAPFVLPLGEVRIGLDPLSAFFLLCVFLVSGLAALYGAGYLAAETARRPLGTTVALFNLLIVAMAGVVLARDAVLFLVMWEVMSIASFFLVTFDDQAEEVRHAGLTYLIASHLGVVFLLVLFGLLARHAGGFGFAELAAAGAPPRALASAAFLLAVVGFGTKAGFWPVHVWLPEAHPAAPSHVSALMSGVMIKLGIYGLLRIVGFLGPVPTWWGGLIVGIGVVSGLAGVLHALAQHDLKRLLAYHSVENIGIIALGVGLGLLGQAHHAPTLAFLGYAGALLHVLNHGLFKGLLFQGAGNVLHGAGTRQIDSLGGLARRMPATSLLFLVGAVAISGLPPLNGFVSEWLIFVGALRGSAGLAPGAAVFTVLAVGGLALIGGLATACFVKAYGIIFLGEPRTAAARDAHEARPAMCAAMLVGALLCVGLGVYPEGALRLVARPAAALAGLDPTRATPAAGPLGQLTRVAVVLVGVIAALAFLRRALLARREVRAAATWGCGYAAPSPRMQYTAASFADPILGPFALVLPRHLQREGPDGYFPPAARCEEHPGDLAGERLLVPLTRRALGLLERTHVLQHGKLQLYLVYVLLTLVALLVWQLAG